MAARYQTSKTELVAIYRLEFYKKQKNWKYFSQERKKEEEKRKVARKSKAKLNKTYNIEPAPERDTDPVSTEADELKDLKLSGIEETEEPSQKEVEDDEPASSPSGDKRDNLNEAFVDTETDDPGPASPLEAPGGPYSPKWSVRRWLAAARRARPDADALEPLHEAEPQCYGADVPHLGPDLPQYGARLDAMVNWEQYTCEEGWPAQSLVWTNKQDWFEEPPAEGGDAVDGMERALLDRARCWLGSEQSETGYCDSLASVSTDSFTRGAALAPHSTEIDLRISEEPEAALSAPALAAAVAAHAAALRALLAEARRRDQASTSPVDQLCGFDQYPIRDAGSSCPAVGDVVVTGSFRSRPALRGGTDARAGRGRGERLDCALIGIGRGRPYRL